MSTRTDEAIIHLDAAINALRLSAAVPLTIAEDLKRVDAAVGPKGASIFARVADSIDEAYTELMAARAQLIGGRTS